MSGALLPDGLAPADEDDRVKNKASVAHDFMKVSRDLEEALARVPLTACELRVIAWVKARTYGVRVKDGERWAALDAIAVSSSFVSTDTGLNRNRVRDAVEALLRDGVLRRKTNGWLGINSRLDAWKREKQGRDFNFDAKPRTDIGRRTWDTLTPGQGVPGGGGQGVPENGGQGVPGDQGQGVPGAVEPSKERARVENGEREIGESPKLLLNGKNDTPHARAEAGLVDFPPMDHPAYARQSFKMQDKQAERWEERVKEERKKTACRKCQIAPRHSDGWPLCRGCTECSACGAKPGNGRVFVTLKNDIVCKDCKEKPA